MGIEDDSLQLRILYPNVRRGTKSHGSVQVKGVKDGDINVALTLRKFAIPSMVLCISHGYVLILRRSIMWQNALTE